MRYHGRCCGFTLIELLVVIAIISVLASILIPSLKQAQSLARGAACMSNLHGLGAAYTMYATDHDGMVKMSFDGNWPANGGSPYWMWAFRLWGYIEGTFSDSYWFDGGDIEVCPSQRIDAEGRGAVRVQLSYARVWNTTYWYKPGTAGYFRISDVKDTSNQILLMDAHVGYTYNNLTTSPETHQAYCSRWFSLSVAYYMLDWVENGLGASGEVMGPVFQHVQKGNSLFVGGNVSALSKEDISVGMMDNYELQ